MDKIGKVPKLQFEGLIFKTRNVSKLLAYIIR